MKKYIFIQRNPSQHRLIYHLMFFLKKKGSKQAVLRKKIKSKVATNFEFMHL